MKTAAGTLLRLSLAAWVILQSGICGAMEYEHPETKQLVTFVQQAAQLVARQGENAFALFKKQGGPWFSGDRYVFIIDIAGNRYVYPPDPDNERINVFSREDIDGKSFGKMFTDAVDPPRSAGWVHYQWTRPYDIHPVWKTTYLVRVRAPSGTEYVVGSGVYNMPMEKAFIVDVVNDAAAMLHEQGTPGFTALRDKRSKYIFKDTYVFVTSGKGVEVVNPAFPMLEGRNIINAVDAAGRAFVREYIEAARNSESAWVSYKWPKPGETLPATKEVYVKRAMIGDEFYVVGSGVYTDWLKGK